MKRLVIGFVGLATLLIGVYTLFPNAVNVLGFSGLRFFEGEAWRILTFPLAHISGMHLAENLVALFIVLLLAYELELSTWTFALLFLVSGVVVVLLGGVLFPYLLVAGASLGIYSLFGALSLKGQQWVPVYIPMTIFGIIIFLNAFYAIYVGDDFTQSAYHLAGFVTGAVLFKVGTIKRKKKVLE